jgi:hypothetical protein
MEPGPYRRETVDTRGPHRDDPRGNASSNKGNKGGSHGSVKRAKRAKRGNPFLLEWEALIGGEEGNLGKEGFNKEGNLDKAGYCSPYPPCLG